MVGAIFAKWRQKQALGGGLGRPKKVEDTKEGFAFRAWAADRHPPLFFSAPRLPGETGEVWVGIRKTFNQFAAALLSFRSTATSYS